MTETLSLHPPRAPGSPPGAQPFNIMIALDRLAGGMPPTLGIRCNSCHRTSWNPNDRVNLYCGCCAKFHERPDDVEVEFRVTFEHGRMLLDLTGAEDVLLSLTDHAAMRSAAWDATVLFMLTSLFWLIGWHPSPAGPLILRYKGTEREPFPSPERGNRF